jgi:hypothetical protein
MAKAEVYDKMRLKFGFDVNEFSSPLNIVPFIFDHTTPTKIRGATRYMVVVDVPMYNTVAPDVVVKEVAMVAEEVEE